MPTESKPEISKEQEKSSIRTATFWHQITLTSSLPQCLLDPSVWGLHCRYLSECAHLLCDVESTAFTSKYSRQLDVSAPLGISQSQGTVKALTRSSYLISVKKLHQWQKLRAKRGQSSVKGHRCERYVDGLGRRFAHVLRCSCQKVMKDDSKASKPSNSRSYSTSAVRRQDLSKDLSTSSKSPDPVITGNGNSVIQSPITGQPDEPGHKFGLPSLPLPSNRNLHHRYEPIVEQLTGLLIRHGKKGVAQRVSPLSWLIPGFKELTIGQNVNYILSHLRTSPPPKISPTRPLLPGHPPPSHLPLNPVLYLTLAIDSVAPLLRIRSQRGAAGGGVALQIPIPLGLRRRRRTAIMWILAAAAKRKNRGSGRNMFAQRIAEELISVVEGRSSVWDQRNGLHKQGVAARANLFFKPRKR